MFASLAASPRSFRKIRVLLDSPKDLGGKLFRAALVVLYPDSLDVTVENARLLKLPNAHMIPLHMSSREMDFPRAIVAIGAAPAEKPAAGKAENLVWLLEDTLVLKNPSALVLPDWKQTAPDIASLKACMTSSNVQSLIRIRDFLSGYHPSVIMQPCNLTATILSL